MDAALLAGLGALGTSVGLVAIELHEQAAVQSVQLHFGRDVTPEALMAVIDRLSGLHPGARVVLDAQANGEGISHYLHSDQATLETLRGSFRALLPSLRLESVKPCLKPEQPYHWGRRLPRSPWNFGDGGPGVIVTQ